MAKALATAQVQSVREIKKKAEIKKSNKKVTIFILALFIALIVFYLGFLGYNYYINSRFEYSETESRIIFLSKEFGVKNAISKVLDTSEIVLVYNINENAFEEATYLTDSIVFLNSILVYKNIKPIILITFLDSKGNILKCITNKGDVYTNEEIFKEECLSLQMNQNKLILNHPDESLKDSKVYISPDIKTVEIVSKNTTDLTNATYIILKSKFFDLEEVLTKIEITKQNLNVDLNIS